MEVLLSLIGGALLAGGAYGLKKLGLEIFLGRYGKIIDKTFKVLDPIAGELIANYDGSMVQEAIGFAVLRVADSNLDEKDLAAIAQYVAEKFSPQIAATKVLDSSTPEGQATLELADSVKALTDGVDRDEIGRLLRNAAALV